ncbi:hypothetical protein [Pontibacter ruber]|uniref:Oligosaccharide repeat unit polymerase n=1 Tax=Pontibacter ruber TaxID=1343895 RepID=A0ABW5CR85_9BACT|nr:hypothetical protein [Pontibacter ruber]
MNQSYKINYFGLPYWSIPILSFILFAILLAVYTDLQYYNVFATGLSIAILLSLLGELNNDIAIRGIISFIYSLQLLLGPALSYTYLDTIDYYHLPIPEENYFTYAIPGIIALVLGLYLPVYKGRKDTPQLLSSLEIYLKHKENAALILIVIGFITSFLRSLAPGGLAFFFFLLSNLKFIGVFYLFYSDSKKKLILSFIVFGMLALDAIAGAMFHDLILWITFAILLITVKKKYSFFIKSIVTVLGLFLLFLVQSVKGEYRNALWYGEVPIENKTNYFQSLIEKRLEDPDLLFSELSINGFIYRINQGWIVGHILYYTPEVEPYAEGETIFKGISASLLPRFLNPEKYVAGGTEYFERFSGLTLTEGTSMNISPLGEFYANFGKYGGILFMFLFGLLFNFGIVAIYYFAKTYPSLILWIPLIFLQVVKAETDFTTVFNHLVKAAFITWLLYWSFQKFFGIRL